MSEATRYRTLDEFYPFYLGEHRDRTCRRLHFTGTSLSLILLVAAVAARSGWLLLLAPLQAYALAWIGHFFYEHNRPATFTYPLLSLRGDWRMWWEILTGKIPL